MNDSFRVPRTQPPWLLWWPVVVMMLGTLLSYLDRAVLALLSPMILSETKLSTQAYGEVITVFSLAYMLSTPLWGSILDRIGLRLGMTISVAIWMAASASHSLVSTFLGFALARGALGLGEGSMFPGGFRTAMDTLPVEKQARGIAIAYSGSSLGSLLAPLLITPVALAYGWRMGFLIVPAAAFLWLLLWLGTVPRESLAHSRRAGRLKFPSPFERRFWRLVSSYALGAMPLGVIVYLAPLYLSRGIGLSQHKLGMVLWIPPAGLEAGYFFWGWLSDRYAHGNPRPLWLFALMGVFFIPGAATAWFHSAPIAIALMTATLFAAAGFIVVALRTGALAYQPEERSGVAGVASGSFSAAVALMVPFCGRLFDAHLYTNVFLLVAVMPLIGTIAWWLLLDRPQEPKPDWQANPASPVEAS